MRIARVVVTITLSLMILMLVFPASCSREEAKPVSGATDTKIYTGYGFSFEYPKGWTISEMGMLQSQADSGSGIVQALKGDDRLRQVAWVGMVEDLFEMSGGLAVTLDDSFAGLMMDGFVTDLEKGEIVESSHWGHELMYQDFIAEGYGGESFCGVVACFYCDDSERLYQVMIGDIDYLSKSERLFNFQLFLDSLICH